MHAQQQSGPDIKNLVLAVIAATAIMFGWQYFYEGPRQKALQAQRAVEQAKAAEVAKQATIEAPKTEAANDVTAGAPRIKINTPNLHGSISLVGARFDDLTLAQYRETLDAESPEVKLLDKASAKGAYFVELGVLGQNLKLPDATTRWQSADTELTVEKPVTLSWNNGAGLTFERKIAIDEHYMFTITTTVKNGAGQAVTLFPYGLISRNYADSGKHVMFMHEGPLGVANDVLTDFTYKKLREDGVQKFADGKGWIGMTDKYWLTAIIPAKDDVFDAEYKHFTREQGDAYQVDLRGKAIEVAAGTSTEMTTHLFAGAKVVSIIDHYRDTLAIPLFDRAVDFGTLYFLTRPIFALLSYFHSIVGNFGIAIMLLTLVIKALLYPLAHKSMVAMARMKQLTPKMMEIRERYKDGDKMRMNQEIMELYKREKVNPAAGCLPILLQIPVFFALYRVLYVTIEMRHAPFYGWIHDLSAIDPTNVFTLFGLVPWNAPSFLHIGVLPLIMCATMVIQQKLNPKPADEIQAMMMNWMPYIFLFMFAGFPAGLVLYWVVNNTLSIAQQAYINTHLTKKGLR